MSEMRIGVRVKTGTATRYDPNFFNSPKEFKKWGIRPATQEEERKYYELLPLWKAHKIQSIKIA